MGFKGEFCQRRGTYCGLVIEKREGCHFEKQLSCSSRISPYLQLGIIRFSIYARYSSVKLDTTHGSPSSMRGFHSNGAGCRFLLDSLGNLPEPVNQLRLRV
jgi:hypothetical protein